MRFLKVVGIGMGDPGHLTGQALRAIRAADIILTLDKGPAAAALAEIRTALLAQVMDRPYRIVVAPDPRRDLSGAYEAGVAAWHAARAALYAQLLERELPEGGCAGFLVWGDPALYDSTLRILDRVREGAASAFAVEVVPGLSAPQILAARHGIVLNAVGGAVMLTTGRRLAAEGWPAGAASLVVMLDGEEAFARIDPTGLEIFWAAYLGLPQERLIAGPLASVADEIVRVRRSARAEFGWIMDTYLIRREEAPTG